MRKKCSFPSLLNPTISISLVRRRRLRPPVSLPQTISCNHLWKAAEKVIWWTEKAFLAQNTVVEV